MMHGLDPKPVCWAAPASPAAGAAPALDVASWQGSRPRRPGRTSTTPSRDAPHPAAASDPPGHFATPSFTRLALLHSECQFAERKKFATCAHLGPQMGRFSPSHRKPPARPVHPPAVVRVHHPGAKTVPRRGFTIGGACGPGRAGAFFEPSRGAAGADAPGVRAGRRGRSAGGTGAPCGRRCAPRFHQDAARPPI